MRGRDRKESLFGEFPREVRPKGEKICYVKNRGSIPGRWNSSRQVREAGKDMAPQRNRKEDGEARVGVCV